MLSGDCPGAPTPTKKSTLYMHKEDGRVKREIVAVRDLMVYSYEELCQNQSNSTIKLEMNITFTSLPQNWLLSVS